MDSSVITVQGERAREGAVLVADSVEVFSRDCQVALGLFSFQVDMAALETMHACIEG